jgi:hypothetical protein
MTRMLKSARPCRNVQQARTVSTQASPVEVMQVANEGAFIGGVAGTMIAMTLIVRLHSWCARVKHISFHAFCMDVTHRAHW